MKAVGTRVNDQIANTLLPSSERLRELRDEFGPMARREGWVIYSFQEQYGVAALNNSKVVDDTSSQLNIMDVETSQHIASNHLDMCRFAIAKDVEYQKVVAAVERIMSSPARGFSSMTDTTCVPGPTVQDRYHQLVDSLQFEQSESRQASIITAHAKTCRWILHRPEYKAWLDTTKTSQHNGFFWLKGNPATGKSTMMKFIHAHITRTHRQSCIISFFFNARGETLERTTVGMYRSFLHQLFTSFPKVATVLDTLPRSFLKSSTQKDWDVETLAALLRQTMTLLANVEVIILIDALDECPEDDVRDMVAGLESIMQDAFENNIRQLVCLSSRHYPHIVVVKSVEIVLEGEEGHQMDIAKYIDSDLRAGSGAVVNTIKTEILARASGIFLWVVLVVKLLNKAYAHGRMSALRQTLDEIPDQLEQLFVDILTRDNENIEQLVVCLQWILYARTPLKREELYFAILAASASASNHMMWWDQDDLTVDDMTRLILSCSKGLADVTKSKKQTIQFIHESVREFLRNGGLKHLHVDLERDSLGNSHDRLKSCCMSYLTSNREAIGFSTMRNHSGRYDDLRKQVKGDFPFLEYAPSNVLYHANAAQQCDVPQNEFLLRFPVDEWIKIYNQMYRQTDRHVPEDATLLRALNQQNVPMLGAILIAQDAPLWYQPNALDGQIADRIYAAITAKKSHALLQFLQRDGCPSPCDLIFMEHGNDRKGCSCLFHAQNLEDLWRLVDVQSAANSHRTRPKEGLVPWIMSIGSIPLLVHLYAHPELWLERKAILLATCRTRNRELLSQIGHNLNDLPHMSAEEWIAFLSFAGAALPIQSTRQIYHCCKLDVSQKRIIDGALLRIAAANYDLGLLDFLLALPDLCHGERRFASFLDSISIIKEHPLMKAVDRGQVAVVASILTYYNSYQEGALDAKQFALRIAVSKDDVEMVKELLK